LLKLQVGDTRFIASRLPVSLREAVFQLTSEFLQRRAVSVGSSPHQFGVFSTALPGRRQGVLHVILHIA
jgi:hypothetical protein